MTNARNWPETLWRSSYKGVPFWFEQDEEEGGRALVIHEFPNRDDPYVEDLGERPRFYSGTAYVHGDDADARAKALIAVCTQRGAGVLVTPLFGPVTVQAHDFKRRHDKDKQGFVGFTVRFVRDGAAFALVSLASLANAAFGAIDALAASIAANLPGNLSVYGQPDYVVAAATDGLATSVAALDAVRISNAVDPAQSAVLRDTFANLVTAADSSVDNETVPGASVSELAASIVSGARALGDAMQPDQAAAAFSGMAEAFTAPSPRIYRAPSEAFWFVNLAASARLARLAALSAFADALIRRTYAARPDGITARAEASARFDDELQQCNGALDADLFVAIHNVRAAVVDFLTRTIADLKPVVTVETISRRPSLVMAWRLYADPLRGDELVARNRVRHPSFLPETFEALAA